MVEGMAMTRITGLVIGLVALAVVAPSARADTGDIIVDRASLEADIAGLRVEVDALEKIMLGSSDARVRQALTGRMRSLRARIDTMSQRLASATPYEPAP